jgi:iron(III) transport system permease protein
MSGRFLSLALQALLAVALLALFAWPALAVTLRALAPIPADAFPPLGLARPLSLASETARLVVLTELLTLPLGAALACLLFRTDLPGRRGFQLLILLGLFIPLPLQALAWLGSFGNLGRQQALGSAPILVGLFGAAFVHAAAALPWVVLIIGVGLLTVEPELEETALLSHAPLVVFFRVSLRRALGPILGAALALAVLTAADMTVTDLIPLRTYSEESYTLAQMGLDPGRLAIRSTLPQAVLLALCLALMATRFLHADPQRLSLTTTPQRLWNLGPYRWPAFLLVAIFTGLLSGLPLYGLIWRAGRVGVGPAPGQGPVWSFQGLIGTLTRAWSDLQPDDLPRPRTYLAGTLLWCAISASIALAIAWPLAWLARRSPGWRAATIAAVTLALATPGPIVGLALKLAYAPVDWLNRTPALLVAAYIIRVLPFAFLFLWPAVRGLAQDWFDIAATSGHAPLAQALRFGVPLTRNAIAATWLLALALSLGELPAAYFVRAPGYDPIAILVWGMLHMGVESRLAGIGLILLGVTGALGLLAASFVIVDHPRSQP